MLIIYNSFTEATYNMVDWEVATDPTFEEKYLLEKSYNDAFNLKYIIFRKLNQDPDTRLYARTRVFVPDEGWTRWSNVTIFNMLDVPETKNIDKSKKLNNNMVYQPVILTDSGLYTNHPNTNFKIILLNNNVNNVVKNYSVWIEDYERNVIWWKLNQDMPSDTSRVVIPILPTELSLWEKHLYTIKAMFINSNNNISNIAQKQLLIARNVLDTGITGYSVKHYDKSNGTVYLPFISEITSLQYNLIVDDKVIKTDFKKGNDRFTYQLPKEVVDNKKPEYYLLQINFYPKDMYNSIYLYL